MGDARITANAGTLFESDGADRVGGEAVVRVSDGVFSQIDISGDLILSAIGIGGGISSGDAGNGTGGTARVEVDDVFGSGARLRVGGNLVLDVRGQGGSSGLGASGSGTGGGLDGQSGIFATNNGTLIVEGDVIGLASGTGGSASPDQPAGTGTGGQLIVSADTGGSIAVTGEIRLDTRGIAGNLGFVLGDPFSPGFGIGGDGLGGTSRITIADGTLTAGTLILRLDLRARAAESCGMRILLSAAIAALVAAPALAQSPALPHVALETALGTITLKLEADKAPATVANFLRYVDEKRLDGTSFYRAMLVGEPGSFGLIQGGVQGDPKRLLPPVKHEPTTQTGLSNISGAISMARAAPGTATADFFIILGNLSSLDAKTEGEGDILGFAPFGQVVAGMEVVTAIQTAQTDPEKGKGAMKGQMLAKPIAIKTARRVAPPPPPEPEPAPAAEPEFDPSELPQP